MAALPPFVTPVGLFVDAATETIVRTARELGLRHIQLHGTESPERVSDLKPLVVIKAVRVDREHFADELAVWREKHRRLKLTNLAGLVLETAGTSAPGGTGVANDWETVREARSAGHFEGIPAIIAAGGLTPESVGAVVRDVLPYAVDVSSGVEESKGRKSAARVEAFVRAVREADADARAV